MIDMIKGTKKLMDSLEIKLETLTNPMGSYSVGQ